MTNVHLRKIRLSVSSEGLEGARIEYDDVTELAAGLSSYVDIVVYSDVVGEMFGLVYVSGFDVRGVRGCVCVPIYAFVRM